jgi:lipopolysaccharide export system ATP-binding protein
MKIFGFKRNPLKNKEENSAISDEAIENAAGEESHGEYIDESEADELVSAVNETTDDTAESAEGNDSTEAEEEANKVLRTENLVKIYGKRTVVNHVSIDVTQGEIVGLLGPNGAGKTTTFYMTTGLITPNDGKIFLNDTDITKYPVYKRAKMGIGYLAQEASVFRKLSVEDNIRAVLEMTNTSKAYQKEKLESLIAEFRLEKVRKNYGDRLSGGERRRTEIARCLAIDPKFIMLDEPFAGVDPIAVEDIQSIVYKLKEKNIGILITDHNANETLSITDRAYLLFEGKILFQGTSEELAANPVVREKYLGRNFEFRRKHFI